MWPRPLLNLHEGYLGVGCSLLKNFQTAQENESQGQQRTGGPVPPPTSSQSGSRRPTLPTAGWALWAWGRGRGPGACAAHCPRTSCPDPPGSPGAPWRWTPPPAVPRNTTHLSFCRISPSPESSNDDVNRPSSRPTGCGPRTADEGPLSSALSALPGVCGVTQPFTVTDHLQKHPRPYLWSKVFACSFLKKQGNTL